jgi:uncharacterized protein
MNLHRDHPVHPGQVVVLNTSGCRGKVEQYEDGGAEAVLTREIDRIAPTLRPAQPIVGYQHWRDLLFLHWPVPVGMLRPLIPAPLSIDTYEGTAYIGLVPFWMFGVRPGWAPERSAFRFLETNVRTYTHLNGRDPSVYFFSLEAASAIAVSVARAQFGLPYFWARMGIRRDGPRIEYRSRRLFGGQVRTWALFEPGAQLGPSVPGSLEHFLIERYYLHVERSGRLWRGQVHHTAYPLQRATLLGLHDELLGAAGLPQPVGPPPLVHFVKGVDVNIHGLQPV